MRRFNLIMCVLMGLPIGQISYSAEERTNEHTVMLDAKNAEIKGHMDIDLKTVVQNQLRDVNVNHLQLNAVEVYAKGQKFGAIATLTIGNRRSAAQPIPVGNYSDVNIESFTHMEFLSPADNMGLNWILTIHGNAQVHKLILRLNNTQGETRTLVEVEDLDQIRPYPRPGPRFPDRRYPDSRHESVVFCASDNYRSNACYIPDGYGRQVSQVYIRRQLSRASCYQNRDWFLDQYRNRIVVRNGCRAEFVVVHTGRGRR